MSLFESDPTQPVSRDLSEAVLNAHSHFIPRLGWLIQGGAALGLNEPTGTEHHVSVVTFYWIAPRNRPFLP